MCVECGTKSDGKSTRLCPECKKRLVEVAVYAESTVKENTVLPGIGRTTLHYSVEAIQDLRVAQAAIQRYRASEPTEEEIRLWETLSERHAFGYVRTPEPTECEIKDWQHYDKFFAGLDHEAVKKRYNVHVIREEEPYEYMGEDSWDIGSRYRQ